MALPELPDEGQDPWFEDRDNFDAAVRGELEGRLSENSLNSSFAGSGGVIPAWQYGVRGDTGTDQSAALHAAFAAGEARGGGCTIQLPMGKIRLNDGFQLSGYSSGMRGGGASAKSLSVETGTILEFVNQTRPGLDFTGFVYPNAMRGRVTFEGFSIKGDGVEGANNKGVFLGSTGALASIDFRNVTIYNTGGVGLHVKDHYLSDFYGVTVCNPVNAGINDTPWVLLEGANGNRYYGLGFRSLNFNDNVADVGPSGALRLVTGLVFQHHTSVFYGPWFENLHLGDNASIVVMQANNITYSDQQIFDCYRVPNAINTSFMRLEPPTSQNYGGNWIRGRIQGRGTLGADNEIELGVDVTQSNNRIDGTKGFGGNNVQLGAGVEKTFVLLAGATVPGNNTGIIDNSGVNTNTLIDTLQGSWILPTGRMSLGGTYVGDTSAATTASANFALSATLGTGVFRVVLNASVTMTALTSNSSQAGRRITVVIVQGTGGSRTLNWPSNVKFAGGVAPTLSTAVGASDTFSFVYAGGNWVETSRAMGVI